MKKILSFSYEFTMKTILIIALMGFSLSSVQAGDSKAFLPLKVDGADVSTATPLRTPADVTDSTALANPPSYQQMPKEGDPAAGAHQNNSVRDAIAAERGEDFNRKCIRCVDWLEFDCCFPFFNILCCAPANDDQISDQSQTILED